MSYMVLLLWVCREEKWTGVLLQTPALNGKCFLEVHCTNDTFLHCFLLAVIYLFDQKEMSLLQFTRSHHEHKFELLYLIFL